MEINSISFLLFFSILFLIYYFPLKGKGKGQNALLAVAGYIFYACADPRMLLLLLGTTFVFFFLGKLIYTQHCKGEERKAYWTTTFSVILGLLPLLYFKYFNFFIESFAALFNAIGLHVSLSTFQILMPLGISFFTFKLISYVVEINRGKQEPTSDLVAFSTYISFFPCLLSGPIDRPGSFLPQLSRARDFDAVLAVDGCRQILWGLFKKMVIADHLAGITARVWGHYAELPGSILAASALLYTFQLYADFSGYSDMAIGVGKLLGLKVTKNFNYPFFAQNVADYWRRWHISLTSWLTDYVFIPLNIRFRNYAAMGVIAAIIINFILVGMWHGANMTYVAFGLYHGLLFIPLILRKTFMKKPKWKTGKYDLPLWQDFRRMICTYLLVSLGLILFCSQNLTEAYDYVSRMLLHLSDLPFHTGLDILPSKIISILLVVSITAVIGLEWKCRNREYGLCILEDIRNSKIRLGIYYLMIGLIVFCQGDASPFIYFQF